MKQLVDQGIRQIIFADLGKNIYPFWRAARRLNLNTICIADDRFAAPHRSYRGVPILTSSDAPWDAAQAVVVSNTSPVHACLTQERLAAVSDAPVHRWFGYDMPDPSPSLHGPLEAICTI